MLHLFTCYHSDAKSDHQVKPVSASVIAFWEILYTVEALVSNRNLKKMVVTRAGCLREWALVSDRTVKQ